MEEGSATDLWSQPANTDELDDNHFDVVIDGTGMVEAALAGALARSGVKVLHLDVADYYGGEYSSLNFRQFVKWAKEKGADLHFNVPEDTFMSKRQWNIDITPRPVLSSGTFVETLIDSSIGRYLEFKNVDTSLIYYDGKFLEIPNGKSAVFKSKDLAPMEKRRLMQLFELCVSEDTTEIDKWADRPFVDFLKDKKLNDKLTTVILYAMCGVTSSTDPYTTAQGAQALKVLAQSVGRFGPTSMIYPCYGVAELPQALCRVCAIFRGTYVLRRSAKKVVVDDGEVVGVECSAGQRFACRHFITSEAARGVGGGLLSELLPGCSVRPPTQGEARAVVLLDRPLFTHSDPDRTIDDEQLPSISVAIIPPGSLGEGLPPRSVQVIQLTESTFACPEGVVTLHFTSKMEGSTELENLKEVVRRFVRLEAPPNDGDPPEPRVQGTFSAFFTTTRTNSLTPTVDATEHGKVEGLYYCSGPNAQHHVDDTMEEARSLFKILMEREVKKRPVEEPKEADENEIPFDPENFLPALPDPESNIPCNDPESAILGLTGIDLEAAAKPPEEASPEEDSQP